MVWNWLACRTNGGGYAEGQPEGGAHSGEAQLAQRPGLRTWVVQFGQGTPGCALANSRNRRGALNFLADNLLAWLVVIRLLMEPLRQLLNMQFARASEARAFAAKAAAAKACMAGDQTYSRFPVPEVASGVDGVKFLEQTVALSRSKVLWIVLPQSFHTISSAA